MFVVVVVVVDDVVIVEAVVVDDRPRMRRKTNALAIYDGNVKIGGTPSAPSSGLGRCAAMLVMIK